MGIGVAGVTLDMASVVQGLIALALAGLVTDHFRLRGEVAKLVTRDEVKRIEDKMDNHFAELRTELQRLAEGLAELRGRSGG